MAGESKIAVTEGSGKNVHTWQRSISAVNVEDDVAIIGEPYLATYSIVAASVANATANSHMMQIMAGASLNVRIRRIRITQNTAAAAISAVSFVFVRLTTAGTGGTVVTPGKYDNGDAAAGATAMTLPTVKGTEGTILWSESMWQGSAAIPLRTPLEWIELPNTKPFIIPAGTANGIAIKNTLGGGASTDDISVEIVESSFL